MEGFIQVPYMIESIPKDLGFHVVKPFYPIAHSFADRIYARIENNEI